MKAGATISIGTPNSTRLRTQGFGSLSGSAKAGMTSRAKVRRWSRQPAKSMTITYSRPPSCSRLRRRMISSGRPISASRSVNSSISARDSILRGRPRVGDSPVGDSESCCTLAMNLARSSRAFSRSSSFIAMCRARVQPTVAGSNAPSLRLDGPAIDRDALGDGFRAAALTQQQVEAVLGGKADRGRALRADP